MPSLRLIDSLRRWFARRIPTPRIPSRRERDLKLVRLEDRRLLNGALNLAGIQITGAETLTIAGGGPGNVGGADVNTVTLTLSAGTWNDPAADGIADTFFDVDGTGRILTVDVAVFEDGGLALEPGDVLQITGNNSNTTLVLDLSGEDFIPSGGIQYDGGGGAGVDSLRITGYSVGTLTVNHVNSEDGSIQIGSAAGMDLIGTVAFEDLEPLLLGGTAADLIINLPAGNDNTVVLSDDAVANDGFSQIDGAFELTVFANPTNSLTINDGTGVKEIDVRGLDGLFNADVTIAEDDAAQDNLVTFETNDTDLDTGDLNVEAEDIALNRTITTTGDVTLSAVTGAITDGNAATVNIVADDLTMTADSGIGNADAIETTVTTLNATNTTSGDIRIVESSGLDIVAPGVRTLAGNGDINIDVDAGTLQILSGGVVTAHGAGTITLNADAGILGIDAAVSSTTGAIALTGDSITQNDEGVITTGGAGTVNATADNGSILMIDGSSTTAAAAIAYQGTNGVFLTSLDAGAANITVNADTDADGSGAITDATAVETPNLITSGQVNLSAAEGIGASGAADLQTDIGTLVATNTTSGDIVIQETNGLVVAVTGVRTQNGNGNISLDVDAGNLTLNGGGVVTAHGAGSISLNVDAGTATLGAVVSSTTGLITIAADVVAQNANITTGGAGTVSVTADNGSITMAAAATTTAASAVDYSAAADVLLSRIAAGAATVTVTADNDASGSGAIQDNTAGETALVSTTGAVVLSAGSGIGAAGAGDIDLESGMLAADNSTSNLIVIEELAAGVDLTVLAVSNGSRDVTLTSTSGGIVDGNAAALNITGGTVTLNAANGIGSGDALETSITRLEANNTTLGLIQIAEVAAGGNLELGLVSNLTRDVILTTADGSMTDGNAGADNVRARNLTLNATGLPAADGNIGSTTADVFKGTFDAIEVDLTGNLDATATGAVSITGTIAGASTVVADTAMLQSDGNLDVSALVITVNSLGLVADADNNGAGTLTIGATLTVANDLRVQGADVVATDGSIDLAATRILFGSDQTEAINVTAAVLDASAGDLFVNATGSVDLVDLDCDNVALQSTSLAGNVQLFATGNVTVTDDVIAGNDAVTNSTGAAVLFGVDVTISDTVLSDDGLIFVSATNDLILDALTGLNDDINGDLVPDTDDLNVITSVQGNIFLQADSDFSGGGVGGVLTMSDGTRIVAGRDDAANYNPGINGVPSPSVITLGAVALPAGQAQILMQADGDVTVASAQSANSTASAVDIRSLSGAIADAGDTDPDILANFAGAQATLSAITGIGDLNSLEINVSALNAVNTLSGAIRLTETDDIALDTVNNGTRDVVLAAGDAITDGGDALVDVVAGTATLSAVNGIGDANALEITVTTLNAVNTTAGAVRLVETNDIAVDTIANGTRDVVLAAGGAITDGGDGLVDVVAGSATLSAANGIGAANALEITVTTINAVNTTASGIALIETDDIALDTIDNGARAVNLQAGGAITDGSDGLVDVVAGTATLSAVNGIGDANALEITVTTLNAVNTTAGAVRLTETDDIALDTIDNNARDVSLTAAAGALTDGGDLLVDVVAGTATLLAANGIGSGDALEITVTTINAVNTTANSVVLVETDDIALDTIDNGTRAVGLQAGGAITDGGDALVDVVAGFTVLLSDDGIGDSNPLETTVDTLFASNSTGGTIEIAETDAISLAGATTPGNLIRVVAAGAIATTAGATIRATDSDVAPGADTAPGSGETIELRSGGNITIGSGTLISTDDNPAAGVSEAATQGDSVVLNANAGTGTVTFAGTVTIRTDGGVATRFAPRPEQALPGNAFLPFTGGVPILANVLLVGINYEVSFTAMLGAAGEENLRVDIDWRDPIVPGDIPGDRIESQYFNAGPQTVQHTYSLFDFEEFVNAGNPTFNVDFSVSHHESISVLGANVFQTFAAAVPGGRITSSDNILTGTGGPGPFTPPNGGGIDRTVATVTSDAASDVDFLFEGGLAQIQIPTLFLPPLEPEPQPVDELPPAAPPVVALPAPEVLLTVAETPEFPHSSYSRQSEDYFQLRQFDGTNRIVREGYEHIEDDFGELLLQPRRLKQWVREELNISDAEGLELWLITEKVNQGNRVTVERPVLKFDVANRVPFPAASETPPPEFPELRLNPMPLDSPIDGGSSDPVPEPDPASNSVPAGEDRRKYDDEPAPPPADPVDGDPQALRLPEVDAPAAAPDESGATVSQIDHPMHRNAAALVSISLAAVLKSSNQTAEQPGRRGLISRLLNRRA